MGLIFTEKPIPAATISLETEPNRKITFRKAEYEAEKDHEYARGLFIFRSRAEPEVFGDRWR